MKISTLQLTAHLQRLPAALLLAGEEPLLIAEALEALRHAAHHAGYETRHTFHVETRFDWKIFEAEALALPLFNPKRLLEIHLHAHKLGDAGRQTLQAYLAHPPTETLLFITADKLDSATLNSTWCKTLDQQGLIVQAWPLDRAQLPRWITQHLQQLGMSTTPEGIQCLIDHTEGNLLATKQEIEKLHLLLGAKKITAEEIAETITLHARFNVFQLGDALLQGNLQRTLHILHRLLQEGIEPPLLLWAITRELRVLSKIAMALEQKKSLDTILQDLKIWEKRKILYKQSVSRHCASGWLALLQRATLIDGIIKGAEEGNVRNAIEALLMQEAHHG